MIVSDLYSPRISQLAQTTQHIDRWWANPKLARQTAGRCDFLVGKLHNLPLPGFVAALQQWSQPQSPDWFAYFSGSDHAREVVANSLVRQFGRPYEPADILITNGAFGALAAILNTLVGPGDEVVYNLVERLAKDTETQT